MKSSRIKACLLSFSMSLSACGGFASASDLERMDRGPAACSQSCRDLGMQMGALALIDKGHSGCVCVPSNTSQAATQQQGGAVVAATAMLADMEAQRQQQQQQQRRSK